MKDKKKTRSFSKFICLLALIVLGTFLYLLKMTNVLPSKYFLIIAITLGILWLLYLFICLNRRIKKSVLVFFNIAAIFIILIEGFGCYKIYEAYDWLDNGLQVRSTKDIYYVVVNSNSTYKGADDIKDKTIYYFKDIDNINELTDIVKKKFKVNLKEVEDYSLLFDGILEDNEKIVLINSGSYDALLEIDETYNGKLKVLDKVEFEKILEENKSEDNIMKKPFTFYLSGIDTRTDSMPARSLSDVNMFIVVNPEKRDILMVNIPRDYYVQLHGTKGLKDKLTHAGILGGLELSKSTVEDVIGYKADYYARVNFNAVIKLVDVVFPNKTMPINSDVNYTFKCWTNRSCTFKPGINKVGGECALAFARERHAYKTGDRHRGENQQQVIKVLVDKLTSTKSLLNNYGDILEALSGTFESNLSTKNITSVVNYQLNDMRGWNFITANLDGTGGNEPTYSYPKSSLSVMYPNNKTIEEAKTKIKEVLGEED